MKRFLLWSSLFLLVALVAALLGFRYWFLSYLRSEPCRRMVSDAASQTFQAEAAFTLFQADSLDSLYTDSFTARNGPGFRLIQADQLRADVHFGFLSRSCTVEALEIARLRLIAGDPAAEPPPPATAAPSPAMGAFSLKRVQVRLLEVGWNGGAVTGTTLVATPSPEGEWLTEGQGGTFRPSLGPEWKLETFKGRHRRDGFHLTEARMRSGEKGTARVEGVFGEDARCRVGFDGVALALLLPKDWRARILGNLGGELQFVGKGAGMTFSEGRLTITDGEVVTLPVFDLVARLTRIEGFRKMRLHQASARVVQREGVLEVSDFVVESTGLLRLEGGFTVRDGRISGTLQAGLSESALQWLPGARETLFTTARDGYVWTPVELSGLAAHPQEDLTARLAMAAVSGAADAVGDTLDATREKVEEGTKKVIDVFSPLLPLPLPGR